MAEFSGNLSLEDLNQKCKKLYSDFEKLQLEINDYKQKILPQALEDVKKNNKIFEEEKKIYFKVRRKI